jgi:UDP-N-acetylmuramate--alanine ligase
MLDKKRKIHFIGIGGVGMSGLALILNRLGHEVSGCDLVKSKYVKSLEEADIQVFLGHASSHLEDVEIVVYSSAISKENQELKFAKERGKIVLPRAKMLSEIMQAYPKTIVVAGSHGKTTTTSMVAHLLLKLKLNPTVIVGGVINNVESNSLLGESEFLIAEADESDGSFLFYSPFIEVITNIDQEHLDFYADFNAVKKAFANFIMRCHPEGKVILCKDDPGVKEVTEELSGPFLFYGFSDGSDLQGKILEESAFPLIEVSFKGKKLGRFRLRVPGKHNAQNALGALAVALVLDLPISKALKALEGFSGVRRRLEYKGTFQGALLIDDYAHHPREISATLSAIRSLYPHKKILLLFQPHRYTRTKALWEDFLLALKEPEILLLTEIYPASEEPIPGISGEAFYQAVKEVRGVRPTFFEKDLKDARELLEKLASSELIIMSMGAGNIYHLLEELSEKGLEGYAVA